MPKTKTNKAKPANKKTAAKKPVEEHRKHEDAEEAVVAEHAAEPIVAKGRKAFDFVEEEEAVLPVADKEEAAILGEVATEEDGEDEASLDEEEINPFGDKWEE